MRHEEIQGVDAAVLVGPAGEQPLHGQECEPVEAVEQVGHRLNRLGQVRRSGIVDDGPNRTDLDPLGRQLRELEVVRELEVRGIGPAIVADTLALMDDDLHGLVRGRLVADQHEATAVLGVEVDRPVERRVRELAIGLRIDEQVVLIAEQVE